LHQQAADKKRSSRNQDPTNPLSQKSGGHNTEIDMVADGPFDDQVDPNIKRNAVVSASTGKTLAKSAAPRDPPALDER